MYRLSAHFIQVHAPDGGTMCCWPRAWFLPDFAATWLNHLLTYSTVDGRGYIGLRLRNCNCYNKKFFLAMYMYCMLAWAAWIERARSISGEQSVECFVPPSSGTNYRPCVHNAIKRGVIYSGTATPCFTIKFNRIGYMFHKSDVALWLRIYWNPHTHFWHDNI